MKFGIDSTEKLVNHWMMNCDLAVVKELAETTKDSHNPRGFNFETKVTVNGIELPFDGFENFLNSFVESAYNDKMEQFKDLEAEVQRRLENRMKAEAEPIIDKLQDFLQNLEDVESVIKPYWEK